MNYFFSTTTCAEFKKPFFGKERFTLDVLTIAVVNEKGNVYTALSKQFNPSEVDEITLDKILSSFMDKSHLAAKANRASSLIGKINTLQDLAGRTRFQMWQGLSSFMASGGTIYGYEPYTDFAILKSLINTSLFYLRDLKQLGDELSEDLVGGDYGVSKNKKYRVSEDSDFPVPEKEFALMTSYEKAQWNKKYYEFLMKFKTKYTK